MAMKTPPHPGRLVKSAIEELGLTVAKAAKALGVTRAQVYRVVKGESAISPEMALRLETVFGSTADAWLRMQAAHDVAALRAREITKGLKRLALPDPQT